MKKIFTYLALVVAGALFPIMPAFADNAQQNDKNCVSTSIIQNADGKYCDDGGGGGVWAILNIGLTVLTFGIGIAATAGLIICGIQYATSGTNEAQATKARRRIFEIVIGLIAYAVLYLALNWLIPGFSTTDVSMTQPIAPIKLLNPAPLTPPISHQPKRLLIKLLKIPPRPPKLAEQQNSRIQSSNTLTPLMPLVAPPGKTAAEMRN